jgi:hypothetical protein
VRGAWGSDAVGAVDSRCHWSSSIVCWTEHMTLSFVRACLCENLNLLGLRSATYTSSVFPSELTWWREEVLSFQNHRQTLCDMPMCGPTGRVPLLLGHNDVIASCQSRKSDSEGCSTGHCLFDLASSLGLRDRVLGSTLPPKAVRMSDRKRTCCDIGTLFKRLSVSPFVPCL